MADVRITRREKWKGTTVEVHLSLMDDDLDLFDIALQEWAEWRKKMTARAIALQTTVILMLLGITLNLILISKGS